MPLPQSAKDTTTETGKWSQAFRVYGHRKIIWIFLNGIASGFPWVVVGSSMTLWLKDVGLTRTAIGFFGSIFAAYTFNFLWAPLVDGVRIPLFARLGRRRSWMACAQLVLCLTIAAIAFTDPGVNLVWTSLLALVVAVAGATQDIAIDAYRIDALADESPRMQAAGAAAATSGWWTGYSLMGAVALFLVDDGGFGWPNTFLLLAGFVGLLLLFTLCIREPATSVAVASVGARAREYMDQGAGACTRVAGYLRALIVDPLKDFFVRYRTLALAILAFIFLFKVGEAFLGRMSLVFYSEIGFDKSEIATYAKLVTWWVTIVFSIVSGAFVVRFGLIKGLLVGGVAMAGTNLLFAMMAVVGDQAWAFALTVVLDGFTSSFSTVAFVAFISYLTNTVFSATQYALMASLGNLGRTLVASVSGGLVDWIEATLCRATGASMVQQEAGNPVCDYAASAMHLPQGLHWVVFFILTTAMVVPSLLLLVYCADRLDLWQAKTE